MSTTLKTLVLKTATVTGVKLVTPADRIGLGFGVAAYPTDNLSPGRNPAPRNPEPESARSRELSAVQMRMQLHSGGDPVPPAGPAGCPGAPGVSAGRSAASSASSFTTSWRGAKRATTADVSSVVRLHVVHDRTDLPGDLANDLTGRDCQSPRRFRGKRVVATRKVVPAAAAGK